jgi:hypothetical protein
MMEEMNKCIIDNDFNFRLFGSLNGIDQNIIVFLKKNLGR